MKKGHIVFILDSAHGHINPTLALAALLVQRGYRVTYPVKEYFARRVLAAGAEALIYSPMENKLKLFQEIEKDWENVVQLFDEQNALWREERNDTLAQLEGLYRTGNPDLIIYDEATYLAGREFASKWGIQAIRSVPEAIDPPAPEAHGTSCERHQSLVFSPRFLVRNADSWDARFHFVGPLFGPRKFFAPWRATTPRERTILVSATTGLLPQVDYFRLVIQAFKGSDFYVILSVGDHVSPEHLGTLPGNFVINTGSSHLDMLEDVSLFIGQGGSGSAIEALYCGVPVMLIPPTPIHEAFSVRIAELGLGICIVKHEVSADIVRKTADLLLNNLEIRTRVAQVKMTMRSDDGATRAIALIEEMCRKELLPG